jgi:ABC-type antimicrobial peptide transport system permease subunit
MALGAEARTILAAVVRRTARLVLLGVAIGGLLALLVNLSLRDMLFKVSPADPMTYLAVAAVMLSVGIVAGLVPAVRAAKIDPMAALRTE